MSRYTEALQEAQDNAQSGSHKMKGLRMTFAANLKTARLGAGLDQAQAANVLGVSVSKFRNWESGLTEPPIKQVMSQNDVITTMEMYSIANGYISAIERENER